MEIVNFFTDLTNVTILAVTGVGGAIIGNRISSAKAFGSEVSVLRDVISALDKRVEILTKDNELLHKQVDRLRQENEELRIEISRIA